MAAARAWAAGTLCATRPEHQAEALADARLWGFDDAALAGLRRQLGAAPAAPAVWRQHVPAVLALLAAGTQWRTALTLAEGQLRSRFIGLDYAGARIAIRAAGIAITPGLWAGFQQLEIAARDALNGEG